MTRCSCTADRCSDHGEHAPCSVCRDLTAAEAVTLSSLALGASRALDSWDLEVLQALVTRGLARRRGLSFVATPEGLAAVRKAPPRPLFVERHQ